MQKLYRLLLISAITYLFAFSVISLHSYFFVQKLVNKNSGYLDKIFDSSRRDANTLKLYKDILAEMNAGNHEASIDIFEVLIDGQITVVDIQLQNGLLSEELEVELKESLTYVGKSKPNKQINQDNEVPPL